MHGTREGGKGGPFLWTFGFHLFQWERRCQLGCHFEDGTPSFASFLRSVTVGQPFHYLSICICTLVKPTSKSLCPQLSMHGHMGKVQGVYLHNFLE